MGERHCLPGLLLLGLLGCNTPDPVGRGPANDPLVGGPPLRAASNTTPGPTTPTAGGVPALPAPSGPGSTAALASGSGLTSLDPSRDLKIGTTSPGNTRPGVARPSPLVVLDGPQPLASGTPGTPTRLEGRPNAPLAPPLAPLSYEQLKASLIERGLMWIRVENAIEKGEVKVTCFIANRQAANVIQSHEVTARDEVSALRAVLDKIDGKP